MSRLNKARVDPYYEFSKFSILEKARVDSYYEFFKFSILEKSKGGPLYIFLLTISGFPFLGGGLRLFFQIHSKGLYKHPNDSRNHPE